MEPQLGKYKVHSIRLIPKEFLLDSVKSERRVLSRSREFRVSYDNVSRQTGSSLSIADRGQQSSSKCVEDPDALEVIEVQIERVPREYAIPDK
ncbi:hypothetical protein CDAR_2201 [Caerostris darwini]|uniref:Uncharacterized protein n=1 Tax=Caerostris darwini TaxID=1538125 RepID=A0AAV4RYX2_9ARAC|nr:hypothetical protein CDAR_2201 [Caerostris darwini]